MHPFPNSTRTKTRKSKVSPPQILRKIFWSLEVLVGEDLEFVPDGGDVRLRRDELCHSLLARPDRHERTHDDDELTVVHAVAEGGLAHIQHDLLPCVSTVRQALGTAVAPFAATLHREPSLLLLSSGTPISVLSHTPQHTRLSLFELVRLAKRF